jgi:hypothetical protein
MHSSTTTEPCLLATWAIRTSWLYDPSKELTRPKRRFRSKFPSILCALRRNPECSHEWRWRRSSFSISDRTRGTLRVWRKRKRLFSLCRSFTVKQLYSARRVNVVGNVGARRALLVSPSVALLLGPESACPPRGLMKRRGD